VRNLAALQVRSPVAAAAIARAEAHPQVRLFAANDGHVCGEDGREGEGPASQAQALPRLLASAIDPLGEAKAWAQGVAVEQAAVVAVRGAGLWHHVYMLADRMRRSGAIVVYEPDVQLLRAVLSQVDIAPLLSAMPVSLVVDGQDIAQVSGALEGTEGMVATGVVIADHAPSRPRLRAFAPGSEAFGTHLTAAVQAVRTSVVTTLVQIETTVENLLGNLPLYIDGPGIADLAGSEVGKPAVIVSAGPSLRKNIDLLAQPGVRDRVVIIAVQTVLKQLLAKGIRPHYVTALDYHEISTRFYEGLTRSDVEGVTLVIDPKAHPAIARAFPGVVRCARSEVLDKVLGSELAREMGEVPAGATVAHLAYYLARHLGCTKAIFVGQDLGFTDNQYYSPGAAIHSVWASELSDVQTLESMEWQRIVRMRSLLRRVPGALGGELYADEQMHTYRVQFEREFERDTRRGMTIIDATEGGALKQHTRVQSLASALREHATSTPRATPTPPALRAPAPTERTRATLERLALLAEGADSVSKACRDAAEHLGTLSAMMREAGIGQRATTGEVRDASAPALPASFATRSDALIERAREAAKSTAGNPALWLVEQLNQAGQLKRFKADRTLLLAGELSPLEVQQRQVERDLVNVQWLRDSAARAGELVRWASDNLRAVLGKGKAPLPREASRPAADAEQTEGTPDVPRAARRVWAFVHAHPHVSGLGVHRGWVLPGPDETQRVHLLASTVTRLLATPGLEGVVLAVRREHEEHVRRELREQGIACEGELARVRVLSHELGDALDAHRASVRAARCLNRHSWRGGAGQLCVYDELLCAPVDAQLLGRVRELTGVGDTTSEASLSLLLVGDDWCCVDTRLCERVVERHLSNPSRHRMVFTQAPPGLCGLVIDSELVRELALAPGSAWWRTLGGMLGYCPMHPQMDAIAKDICVPIEASLRDTLLRCTGDDANFGRVMRAALREDGSALHTWDAARWSACARGWLEASDTHPTPEVATIDARGMDEMDLPRLVAEVASLCSQQPALTLCVQVEGWQSNWPALIDAARSAGVWAVQVRCNDSVLREGTPQARGAQREAAEVLASLPIDLLCVELPGDSVQSWGSEEERTQAWESLQSYLDRTIPKQSAHQAMPAKPTQAKPNPAPLPRRWLVPQMPKLRTTTQDTLMDMELFVDRWLLACGTAVVRGEGELALPLPRSVVARQAWSRFVLRSREQLPQGSNAPAIAGSGGALEGAI
jgi:hypothetical protein